MDQQVSLLEVRGIGKSFPGVVALKDVTVQFKAGSVHALMGENGAGKSTLGKIIGGLYEADTGQIILDNKPVSFRSPLEALTRGIAIVHQELLFCENLSVAENLALADPPHRGIWADFATARARAVTWLEKIDAKIDPDAIVGSLSISQQQLLQIAGAVGRGARVIIFDEPTSSLTVHETERLLRLIRELRDSGTLCILVSHRLEEIFSVSDTITVLRDGQLVATRAAFEVSEKDLVQLMVGRDVGAFQYQDPTWTIGEPKLDLRSVVVPNKVTDFDLQVRAGEIVGIAGLVGSGRTEVLESLFGVRPTLAATARSATEAVSKGIAMVPEDRKRHGLVLGLTIRENMALPSLDRRAKATFVQAHVEREVVQSYFDQMQIRAPSQDTVVGGLSGGNQQKVVIGKWLATEADVLLIDEPTRGVDVGAKFEIHRLIRSAASQGKAIVVVSSDMPELLALSDRILVLRDGCVVAELPPNSPEATVMAHMAGV